MYTNVFFGILPKTAKGRPLEDKRFRFSYLVILPMNNQQVHTTDLKAICALFDNLVRERVC